MHAVCVTHGHHTKNTQLPAVVTVCSDKNTEGIFTEIIVGIDNCYCFLLSMLLAVNIGQQYR